MNDETNAEELAKDDSIMLQVIKAEIDDLVKASTDWQKQIKTAKTQAKRSLFKKKLAKNNKKLMQMLVAFERVKANQPAESSLDLTEEVETDIIEDTTGDYQTA